MSTRRDPHESFGPDEDAETEAARREAAAIGGRAGDEDLDPALRPLVEGGEGDNVDSYGEADHEGFGED